MISETDYFSQPPPPPALMPPHDTPPLDTHGHHPHVSASPGTSTPRLLWIFFALITLSVVGVFAMSSQMESTPHLQQVHEAPFGAAKAGENNRDVKNMEADSPHPISKQRGAQNSSLQDSALETDSSAAVLDVVIPRIIHQSWKSVDRIPTRFHSWMQSWRKFHPTWTYVFWTDEDNLRLFEQLYPQYFYVAKAVEKVSLADMARYALLHCVGGLYADADFECLKPFDELHQDHKLFISSEPLVHAVLLENSTSAALCNALMASAPGHPFWLRVLDNIKEKFDRGSVRRDAVALTGPRIVKTTYLSDQSTFDEAGMVVMPSEYFYPEVAYWNIKPMEQACKQRKDAAAKEACEWLRKFPNGEFTNNTYASHHWQCTWCRDTNLDDFSPLDTIFESTPMRPYITATGIEFI